MASRILITTTKAGLVAVLTGMAVTGCSNSPTTTYTNEGGQEVTVNWSNYPGESNIDSNKMLSAPTQEEVEERSESLFTSIETTLSETYDLEWSSRDESGWYAHSENGYGGDSQLVTYNSATRVSTTAPTDPNEWRNLIDRVNEIVTEQGMDELVLEHESSPYRDEAAWQEELFERFSTENPDEYWQWTANALGESQWFSLTITDATRGQTGEAAADYEAQGNPPQSVALTYGATTLPSGSREEFKQALAPFEDLEKLESTHSN